MRKYRPVAKTELGLGEAVGLDGADHLGEVQADAAELLEKDIRSAIGAIASTKK